MQYQEPCQAITSRNILLFNIFLPTPPIEPRRRSCITQHCNRFTNAYPVLSVALCNQSTQGCNIARLRARQLCASDVVDQSTGNKTAMNQASVDQRRSPLCEDDDAL